MEKQNRNIRSIILITLIFLVTGLFIIVKILAFPSHSSQWEEWDTVLEKGETILDGVKEEKIAYILMSSEGRRDYADFLLVLEQKEGVWKKIYENDFKELHPWKIELADVDGDGTKELLTAVHKTAHFDAVMKNRLFVFNYENGILIKKWAGSQFAGEWREFYVGDLLPMQGSEIIFIEQGEKKLEHLSVYYWFDFGFVKLAESKRYKEIHSLSIIEENRIIITYDKKQKKEATLSIKDGKIIEILQKKAQQGISSRIRRLLSPHFMMARNAIREGNYETISRSNINMPMPSFYRMSE